jgi:hypothetical protein
VYHTMKYRTGRLVLSVMLAGVMLFSLSVIVHGVAQARTEIGEDGDPCIAEPPLP